MVADVVPLISVSGESAGHPTEGTVPDVLDFYSLRDLADRWGVTQQTARYYTHKHGFPEALAFSRKTLRWSKEEVHKWEARDARVKTVRRSTPRYRGETLPMPSRVG